jgi:KUP system potassium uptake protein
LFFGDCMLTPAISVLSAAEGLEIAAPVFADYVVPLTIVVVIALFAVQKYGTGRVGAELRPRHGGVVRDTGGHRRGADHRQHPDVLRSGQSAYYAARFIGADAVRGFLILASVFLAVTGAEALYADMGHFGKRSRSAAPGSRGDAGAGDQLFRTGRALMSDATGGRAIRSTAWCPPGRRCRWSILSTDGHGHRLAGGDLGRLLADLSGDPTGLLCRACSIVYTSGQERGQVYLPVINWASADSCRVAGARVPVIQQSRRRLRPRSFRHHAHQHAAVRSGDDTDLAHEQTESLQPAHAAADGGRPIFMAANASKITHGGWFPLTIGVAAFVILTTWKRGRASAAAADRSRCDAGGTVPEVLIGPGFARERDCRLYDRQR